MSLLQKLGFAVGAAVFLSGCNGGATGWRFDHPVIVAGLTPITTKSTIMWTTKTYRAEGTFNSFVSALKVDGWIEGAPGCFLSPPPPPGRTDVWVNIYGAGMPANWSKFGKLDVIVRTPSRPLTPIERKLYVTPVTDAAKAARIKKIQEEILKAKTLSTGDLDFLLSEARTGYWSDRFNSVDALFMATQTNLYGRHDYSILLESEMVKSGFEVSAFDRLYVESLGIILGDEDKSLDAKYISIRNRNEYPEVLDRVERDFVIQAFSRPGFADRRLGLDLMIEKKGLDAASTAWGEAQIKKVLAASTGAEKQCWEFAQRVFAARNP